jgi:hypothetical protein
MAGGDDLVEEIRRLLVQGQIPKFVTDEQCGFGIRLEFPDEGVIDLGGEQVIEHVHGGGKQDALIRLAGAPAHDLGQECFPDPGISDEDQVGAVGDKAQVEQAQDAILVLRAALVMSEVKRVDAGLGL